MDHWTQGRTTSHILQASGSLHIPSLEAFGLAGLGLYGSTYHRELWDTHLDPSMRARMLFRKVDGSIESLLAGDVFGLHSGGYRTNRTQLQHSTVRPATTRKAASIRTKWRNGHHQTSSSLRQNLVRSRTSALNFQ